MQLSKQTLETLIDLVENKLSCMDVWDREDRREAAILQRSLRELQGQRGSTIGTAAKIELSAEARRRGRRPKLDVGLAMA